jgi:hypothetical protein
MMRETQLQALSLAIAEAQPSGLAAILLTFDGSRSTPESGEAFVQEKTLSAILTRSAESVGAAVAKKKKKKKASGKSFARTKGSGHGENTAKRCRAFDEIFRSIVAAARHESSTLQHLRFEALPLFGGDHSGEMIKGGAAGRGRRRNGARGKKSGSAAAAHWSVGLESVHDAVLRDAALHAPNESLAGPPDHAYVAAVAPIILVSRPSFCRVPPGMRSIHPHTWHPRTVG